MDEEDPLEVFLRQFDLAETGQLLETAAEFHPDDPAHAAAWAQVHLVAAAEGMEAEIDRLRQRVAQWATQGTGVTSGHLGSGAADELLLVARAAAAGAIVDAGVAEMLGADLDAETIGALLRPFGLPEMDEAGEQPDGRRDVPDA
jgi:hypothetical protein